MIAASNFPFCTIDPNVGIVDLPDSRLGILSQISGSQKIIPATVSFVDIAGLVKGASKGEGLGNQFLSTIRETDLIVQVVRCFEDDNIIHVEGKVDPISDIEVINVELILSDLQVIDKVLQKLEKGAKGKKDETLTIPTLKRIATHLNNGFAARTLDLTDEEQESIKAYQFLTSKPIVYCANVSEKDLPSMDNQYVQAVRKKAEEEGAQVIPICAKLEEELASLSEEDAKEYLTSLGLSESGLSRLIRTSFTTLGLLTYFTTGEKETRAWTIVKGSTAPEAAGKIHTDLQKGFIRAEVVSVSDMVKYKGRTGAKEAGKARLEGKNYIVQDDDVILFYHN